MFNRKNLRWHVAFIIASSLLLLNPGLMRMINVMFGDGGILAIIIFPHLVLLSILFYEKIKFKRPVFKSPYALIMLMFMLETFLFVTISQSEFWSIFVNKLAQTY